MNNNTSANEQGSKNHAGFRRRVKKPAGTKRMQSALFYCARLQTERNGEREAGEAVMNYYDIKNLFTSIHHR
jgi:hypothetical protein